MYYTNRTILHIDLNNFYASVECLYRPEIRDYPVAVCGSQDLRHGIVLAKNNHAKKYGVKTGEVIWAAKQHCPNLKIIQPNYSLYLRFSRMAREIYYRYSNLFEAFGIDEGWLDITDSTKIFGSGEDIANEIRVSLREELGITASVGVSFNKIFAKLGSDLRKPDYTTVINQENFKDTIWDLPASELLYVGSSTKNKLSKIGITTIGKLANCPYNVLKDMLGKWGETLWVFANGYDDTPVSEIGYESIIKGIGNSMTTARDLENNADAKLTFIVLAESVAERLRKHNFKGKTAQIYVRDNELASFERQGKFPSPTNISRDIINKSMELFTKNYTWEKPIRSLGIRLTDLVTADDYMQLSLFDEEENTKTKRQQLEYCVDDIRRRFGHYSIQRAFILQDKALNGNPIEDNIIHPTSYFK